MYIHNDKMKLKQTTLHENCRQNNINFGLHIARDEVISFSHCKDGTPQIKDKLTGEKPWKLFVSFYVVYDSPVLGIMNDPCSYEFDRKGSQAKL